MAKPTDAQIEKALRECHGMVYVAASQIPCSPNTIKARLAKKPELAEVLTETREAMKDTAELSLIDAVMTGQPWAVQYYLTKQAKDRGYGDKMDVNQTSVNINWDELTEHELQRIAAGEAPAIVLADRSKQTA